MKTIEKGRAIKAGWRKLFFSVNFTLVIYPREKILPFISEY